MILLRSVRGAEGRHVPMAPDSDPPRTGAAGPRRTARTLPELEYYEATFDRDRADCAVQVRLAAGAWKTEVSNDGRGGVGMFVNGHKFSFGKARAYQAYGRSMTVFAVAHNFFGQDRRLVAVDRDGKPHPADPTRPGRTETRSWVIDLIDAEFDLPPDRIKEYQVQFRPFEQAEIKDIALKPRTNGQSTSKPRAGTASRREVRAIDPPVFDRSDRGYRRRRPVRLSRNPQVPHRPPEVQHRGRRRLRRRLAAAPGVHLHDPVGRQGDAAGERGMPRTTTTRTPACSPGARTSSSWR